MRHYTVRFYLGNVVVATWEGQASKRQEAREAARNWMVAEWDELECVLVSSR